MAYSFFTGGASGRTLLPAAVRDRMKGPGGFYNLGNALGLATGVWLQISAGADGSGWMAVADFFAGSRGAVCLTVANLIFFWSGEVYHRAWVHGAPPDGRLNRRGDVLSGYGAIFLGIGLIMLGQPVLALFSGVLHACGKFGSALQSEFRFWPSNCPDPFRSAVLASRVPAVIAASAGLLQWQSHLPVADVAAPLGLLGSYLLWAVADLKLLRG